MRGTERATTRRPDPGPGSVTVVPPDATPVVVFGATGSLGQQCVSQCLEMGHDVTVLARTPSRLDPVVRDRVRVVEGDGLDESAVREALAGNRDALFAIGVDKASPEDLCTDVTALILAGMPDAGVQRLVWCGGGSTRVAEDQWTMGSRIVKSFAETFMRKRHSDKAHQYELLMQNRQIDWVGVRPLQMNNGPRRGDYRVGFDTFSGLSKISFADCADAMVGMLTDDEWLHRAPIVQY